MQIANNNFTGGLVRGCCFREATNLISGRAVLWALLGGNFTHGKDSNRYELALAIRTIQRGPRGESDCEGGIKYNEPSLEIGMADLLVMEEEEELNKDCFEEGCGQFVTCDNRSHCVRRRSISGLGISRNSEEVWGIKVRNRHPYKLKYIH